VGRDSAVRIATRYRLDGPEIECRWGQVFPHPSRPTQGPTQPSVQWVPSHSRGLSNRDVMLTTQNHLAPKLKKSKSMPLPPTGTSWPVLRWTVLLPRSIHSNRGQLMYKMWTSIPVKQLRYGGCGFRILKFFITQRPAVIYLSRQTTRFLKRHWTARVRISPYVMELNSLYNGRILYLIVNSQDINRIFIVR